MMHRPTRRKFLEYSLTGAAGLALYPFAGCASSPRTAASTSVVPEGGYPLIEVEGDHHEIGCGLGEAMEKPIKDYFAASPDFPRCEAFLREGGGDKVLELLRHTRQHFPQYVAELEGMAEGLGMPFMSLFAYNCRSEISVMRRADGCSTLQLCHNKRMILAHNEDGGDVNAGRMYVARVRPPSGVEFISFVYPGLLPGNGPGFNSRGIVQTTNYIEPSKPHMGVPRYIIGRAVLEAQSLDRAVEIATVTPRAFPWHHNLASLPEAKLLSLETYPGRHDVLEVKDLMVHTNHLLHPAMTAQGAGEQDVPYISSTTRYNVLTEKIAFQGPPKEAEGMVDLLSLHEGKPYSPCRHPEGEIRGITLGTAVFEAPQLAMTLYHGNPCEGFKKRYTL